MLMSESLRETCLNTQGFTGGKVTERNTHTHTHAHLFWFIATSLCWFLYSVLTSLFSLFLLSHNHMYLLQYRAWIDCNLRRHTKPIYHSLFPLIVLICSAGTVFVIVHVMTTPRFICNRRKCHITEPHRHRYSRKSHCLLGIPNWVLNNTSNTKALLLQTWQV